MSVIRNTLMASLLFPFSLSAMEESCNRRNLSLLLTLECLPKSTGQEPGFYAFYSAQLQSMLFSNGTRELEISHESPTPSNNPRHPQPPPDNTNGLAWQEFFSNPESHVLYDLYIEKHQVTDDNDGNATVSITHRIIKKQCDSGHHSTVLSTTSTFPIAKILAARGHIIQYTLNNGEKIIFRVRNMPKKSQ